MTRCERQSVSGRSRQRGASLRLIQSALVGAVLALWAPSPASALTITNAGIYLFVDVGQSVGSGCSGCGSLESQGPLPFSDSATISASTPEYVVFATAGATGSGSVSDQVLSVSLDLSPTASAPTPGPGPGSANQLTARTDGYISASFSLSETTTVSLLGSVSGAVTEEAVLWGNPSFTFYGFGTHVRGGLVRHSRTAQPQRYASELRRLLRGNDEQPGGSRVHLLCGSRVRFAHAACGEPGLFLAHRRRASLTGARWARQGFPGTLGHMPPTVQCDSPGTPLEERLGLFR